MADLTILPFTKTDIIWCCREFADSGASNGAGGLKGSLAGTYIATCTMPYTVTGATSGEVTGSLDLLDGFGSPIRNISISHKTQRDDTIVLTGIIVAPESATFVASVYHTFDGLGITDDAHIEICYLAPPSTVTTCSGWEVGAVGTNTNCGDPASQIYTFADDDKIIGFSYEMSGVTVGSETDGVVTMMIDGTVVATLPYVYPGSNPVTLNGSTMGLNIPVLSGQVLTFDVTFDTFGDMTVVAILDGAHANEYLPWLTCG